MTFCSLSEVPSDLIGLSSGFETPIVLDSVVMFVYYIGNNTPEIFQSKSSEAAFLVLYRNTPEVASDIISDKAGPIQDIGIDFHVKCDCRRSNRS